MKDIRDMLSRRYGIEIDRLDSNGYGETIMGAEPDHCYLCGSTTYARHEVVYGTANRQKSKALGLWVTLCPKHHDQSHSDKEMRLEWCKMAQVLCDRKYGAGTFFKVFGRNYL